MPGLIKNFVILCFCLFSASSGTSAEERGPTLQKVKASGTITVGYREDLLPLSYLNDKQEPIGLAIDLCNLMIEKVKQKLGFPGLKVNYKLLTAADSIAMLQDGTLDLACGPAGLSEDRQQKVSFSAAIYLTEYRWLIFRNLRGENEMRSRRQRDIKIPVTAEDLKSKTIVLTKGSHGNMTVLNLSDDRSLGFSILLGKDTADSLLLLKSGRAAAFFENDIALLSLKASAEKPDAFAFLEDSYPSSPYGMMLRKNDKPLKQLVDETIIGAMKSGEYSRLYAKWFNNPIPPKEVNLSFPMSARLQMLVKEAGYTAR